MRCPRCQVNKNEIEFIDNGTLFKQCNSCRKRNNFSYHRKKEGVIPEKVKFFSQRQKALKEGLFICSSCKESKPVNQFAINSNRTKKFGINGQCNNCLKFTSKFSKIKIQYNLSKAEFLRIIEKQNGRCKICNIVMETFTFKNNMNNTLCVDHCHETGKIRGFLCNCCNRAMGLLGDNPEVLLSAYKYIVQFKQEELLETPGMGNQQPSLGSNTFEGSTTNLRIHTGSAEDGNENTSILIQ